MSGRTAPVALRAALPIVLLGAALLAGFIGGGDVLEAITGKEQDSTGVALVTVGAAFLLAGAMLARLALAVGGAPAGAASSSLGILPPLIAVPWWDALGPAGVLVNAALLLAAIAIGRRLAA
jgi:hypothetical protein